MHFVNILNLATYRSNCSKVFLFEGNNCYDWTKFSHAGIATRGRKCNTKLKLLDARLLVHLNSAIVKTVSFWVITFVKYYYFCLAINHLLHNNFCIRWNFMQNWNWDWNWYFLKSQNWDWNWVKFLSWGNTGVFWRALITNVSLLMT